MMNEPLTEADRNSWPYRHGKLKAESEIEIRDLKRDLARINRNTVPVRVLNELLDACDAYLSADSRHYIASTKMIDFLGAIAVAAEALESDRP